MQASRIASLAAAAACMLGGYHPADRRATEQIVIDLMDCASILATQLSEEADRVERDISAGHL
jgi:hypothetical protein